MGAREKDSMTMDDYIETCLKYLEKTVSDLRKGDFAALPLNEQACRNCHERATARIYKPHQTLLNRSTKKQKYFCFTTEGEA